MFMYDDMKSFKKALKVSVDKKSLDVLFSRFNEKNEKVILSLVGNGYGEQDLLHVCWFVLSDYSVYIVPKISGKQPAIIINLRIPDINTVVVSNGMLFSKLVIHTKDDRCYVLDNTSKNDAALFSDYVKKRKDELEKSSSNDDYIAKLEHLFALKEKGALTDEEYIQEKNKILEAKSSNDNQNTIITYAPEKQSSQKKPSSKKPGCMQIIIGIIFFAFIASFMTSSKRENINNKSQTSDSSIIKTKLTREQAAKIIVTKICGEKSNIDGQDKIISLSSIPQADNTLTLDLKLRINDNLTQRYIVIGYLTQVMELMQELFADSKMNDYNEIRIYGAFPMKNMYGNVQEEFISKIFLKRSTSAKINWQNLTPDEFHNLLTRINNGKDCTYWMHISALKGANLK